MINFGGIPPQQNHHKLNPKIPALAPDNMAISQHLQPWETPLRAACVNSYGAAGSNSALICCEMPKSPTNASKSTGRLRKDLALPVIVSAHSPANLRAYASRLALYLREAGSHTSIEDLAFSLNDRRRRQRYCVAASVTNVQSLVKVLESPELPVYETLSDTKHPVLMFSGQYSNSIGLSGSVYDQFPVFRSHLDTCDLTLRNLGYPSIFPAIFQSEPLTDVVLLQCSIVAMQFSCAQTWLDAGLKPAAIIGHSLGELTALAVSGVLSLQDCLKLVAFRAHLIKTKWSSERGTMLAIHSGHDDIQKIAARLGQDSTGTAFEIACYNSPKSHVVVGTSASLNRVEVLLREEPSFQTIKHQRVDTSHGFHSCLAEPILAELDEMCSSLDWKDPVMPLEVCTEEGQQQMIHYIPSKHARRPVFFAAAVQRVEDRLGPCQWVEAGTNTPVIPMTRKATRQPDIHTFHAMATKDAEMPARGVTDVVMSLERGGTSLSHWSFLPSGGKKCAPVSHLSSPRPSLQKASYDVSC